MTANRPVLLHFSLRYKGTSLPPAAMQCMGEAHCFIHAECRGMIVAENAYPDDAMSEIPTPAPANNTATPRPGRRKRRIIRIAIWSACVLLLLPVLAWLTAAAYIQSHKKEVLATVLERLNENLGGTLTVEKMEPALVEDFPHASIALHGVALRDSLWPQHHRDLFKAEKIFVRVSPFSALSSALIIRQAAVEDARFHLFTDPSGYSNGYLLKARDTTRKSRRQGPNIHNVVLRNVDVLIENALKSKRFSLLVQKLSANLDSKGSVENIEIKTTTRIGGLGFNITRGAFLTNKTLEASLDATFDKEKRTFDIPEQRIRVDGDPLKLSANFLFSGDTPSFHIRVVAEKMRLERAVAMLSDNIASKLRRVKLDDPASFEADIRGKMKFRDTPIVRVEFKTKDNVLSVPGARLTDCSFDGYFYNVFRPGGGYGDPNSIVALRHFNATYEGIPVTADTVGIQNLKLPRLYARIRTKFPAERINNVSGGRPFRFDRGTAEANLLYTGSLSLTDTVIPAIYGTVAISGAQMMYTPRGLPLNDVTAQIQFNGTSVLFPKVAFRTGRSTVTMRGEARNALYALHRPQYPASLRWDVQSPGINLSDFMPFLAKRGTGGGSGVGGKMAPPSTPLASRIDALLDRADAHLTTSIGVLEYQKFRAEAVRADVTLTRTQAQVRNASLRHAGGTIQVTGEAEQGENGGPFKMKAVVRDVNVNSLFTTFDNFGQEALTSENIRGIVSFDADLTGRLGKGGTLQQQSLAGNLDFTVRRGALVSFAPLEKVARYVFRRRNLSDLRFEVLKARFNLANERIEILPMEVRSSALSLNLVGVYGLKSGTDISFQIPLRNPKKDSVDLAREADFEAGDKGIVIHLRAQNPTGKKLDIDWDKGGKTYKKRVGMEAAGVTETSAPAVEEETRKQRRERRREERRGQ